MMLEFALTIAGVLLIVSIPFLFGAVAGIAVRRISRKQNRRRLGLCYGCGYDLTGNVSGVCPECGETI